MAEFKIDTSSRVYLKRLFFDRGNAYHPGWYEPGYLPAACMVEGLVTQAGIPASQKPDYRNSLTTQTISIHSPEPITEKTSYKGEKPLVAPTKQQKVNVNKATVDQLSLLPNVGVSTANKIVEARDKEPFKNVDELKKRIELSRGKWEEISDRLLFD